MRSVVKDNKRFQQKNRAPMLYFLQYGGQMSTKQDIWATYDPEKVRAGLQKSAGALKGVASAAL
jgi:hypothetical protein